MNAGQGPLSWTGLLARSFRLYRERFDEYFPLVIGASVLAYTVYFTLAYLNHSVFEEPARIVFFGRRFVPLLLWELEVVVAWLAGAFAFACVSAKVLNTGDKRMSLAQAMESVKPSVGRIVRAGLYGALSTIVFYVLVMPVLLRPLPFILFAIPGPYINIRLAFSIVRGSILLLFSTLLAKMALAIPELVDNKGRTSLREAVGNSLRHTAGHELFLALWLGAAATISAGVYTVSQYFIRDFCLRGTIDQQACSWLQALSMVVILALVATPTFICFSLFHSEAKRWNRVSATGTPG